VTSVYGRFASDIAKVAGFDWVILERVADEFVVVYEGSGVEGAWIADGYDLTAEYKGYLAVVETDFDLDAGTYFLGPRPVGSGEGRAFLQQTTGGGGVGTPLGNGNSFVHSDFFGFVWQEVSLFYGETTDFSLGVVPEPVTLVGLVAIVGIARRATGGGK
jgi:hypothetical protein